MKSKRIIAGAAALAMFVGTAMLSGCAEEAAEDTDKKEPAAETTDDGGATSAPE